MAVYCTSNAFFHYFIDIMAKHYYDRKSEKSSRLKQSNSTTFKGKYGMFSKSRSHKAIPPLLDLSFHEAIHGPDSSCFPTPDLKEMVNETISEMTSPKELMSPSRWELSRLIAERIKSTESNLASRITVVIVSLLGLYVFVKLCQLLLF